MATTIPPNRCSFIASHISQITGAPALANASLRTTSVSIDSRVIAPGALFVALRGARDGHEYLAAATDAGAAAALVERGRASALPCFEVDDPLAALGALARAHLERMRRASSIPTIAIGGAAGKTTTKELTAALMRSLCGATLATPGNLNNLIGVPMTIFTLEDTHRAAVLECGTNQPGEIARLAAIVQPGAALVLNVDIEHTEGLGSLEGVADEEAALFATAKIAVVSTAEIRLLRRIPPAMPRLTFGFDHAADVRLVARTVSSTGQQIIELKLRPSLVESGIAPRLSATLSLLGAASALNAASAVAAAAAALARPFHADELDAIAGALAGVRASDGRLSLHELGGILVIDDTYNSNPRSLRAALAAARETVDGLRTRLIVALGDMLELGELSAAAHIEALQELVRIQPETCLLVGAEMRRAAESASASRLSGLTLAADSLEAAPLVAKIARRGDVLLVKGSRGIAMERIIDALPGGESRVR
ncbi:MAG TPA: UDP-N-acetylmuramoyl-tripeptide--D-alanyl-D-alanine ligase [Candidatus Binataceae bacterium]|nr:UDP-N-acetylmuramoyl-tripeptide--D-alanyl-D-alanine ligase [Candidatus Binataceae bacterium]